MKSAFTMIELIFVIVIIGILASIAVPKFTHLTSNAKISTELATVSSLQTAIDSTHGEWSINEGTFTWGNAMSSDSSDFNQTTGYPVKLGECPNQPFKYILKNAQLADKKWTCEYNGEGDYTFRGPASSKDSGVQDNPSGKPDSNDVWRYYEQNGTICLDENDSGSC